MAYRNCQLDNLNDLRNYVYETLCEHETLVCGAFRMSEQVLIRSGRPCGIHFTLHGPRAVLITAIWENRTNTILFYDAAGERFQKTQLSEAPQLEPVAA